MRILVIGGNGAAGSRIAAEALRRGHEVTVAARSLAAASLQDRAPRVRLDASDVGAVATHAARVDLVIGATRPAVGREHEVVEIARALADGSARAGTRLLVVGGAAPLRIPGTQRTALEDPHRVPPTIRSIAAASTRQLEVLAASGPAPGWTYLAPAADFAPGPSRGRYRVSTADAAGGVPELVIAPDGTSRISMEDFALAACDEAEKPTVRRGVLAVGW